MKAEILQLLRKEKAFVSGQNLCDQFSVSRTAVWKVIGQLKDAGYEIISVPSRGYRLLEVPDTIADYEVISLMEHKDFTGHSVYQEESESTNVLARELAEKGKEAPALVLSNHQVSGKGRRGRTWVNPAGTGIAMSLLLRPEISPEDAPMLTLVAGLAAVKAIRGFTGIDAWIKWPNDVVVSGKKVCGILTEMSTEIELINYVIVGVGINVNEQKFPPSISKTATSLYLEQQKREKVNRARICASFLDLFLEYYEMFLETRDLSQMIEEYNHYLINMGREVLIIGKDQDFKGVSGGINDRGHLLVRDSHGEERAVVSGEVSVRGVYGYV